MFRLDLSCRWGGWGVGSVDFEGIPVVRFPEIEFRKVVLSWHPPLAQYLKPILRGYFAFERMLGRARWMTVLFL